MKKIIKIMIHENTLLGIGLSLLFVSPIVLLLNLEFDINTFASLSFILIAGAIVEITYKQLSQKK